MQLFILIALMCLINTILPDFIRNYIKISRFWKVAKYNPSLDTDLSKAREELNRVQNESYAGEYTRKIKILRAEQNVQVAEALVKLAKDMQVLKRSTIDTVAYYVSRVLFSLIVVIVCARNRYAPVMVLDDSFSLAPLGGLLSFPTGVYNAISVPTWAFSCNFTFSLLYGLVKN